LYFSTGEIDFFIIKSLNNIIMLIYQRDDFPISCSQLS